MNNDDLDGVRFQREGYLLIRSVFSSAEVEAMRRGIVDEGEKAIQTGRVLKSATGEVVPVGDIAGVAGLESLLFDPRLVQIARVLLGTPDIVYFGDSGLMIGGALRGFHKDNTCRDDASHTDWQSWYGLVRMGIYLQDHRRYSGGLKLRVGSHLHADLTTGKILAVPSEPGDVVVWSLRTTHSGHAARMRWLPNLGIQPRFEFRLPSRLLRPEPCKRLAIFMTYGSPGPHLDNYIAKHADPTTVPENYLFKSWLHSDGSARVHQRAAAAGVTFVKPIGDYGKLYGTRQVYPLGHVPVGRNKPDSYPAVGLEALINSVGRGVRFAQRAIGAGRA